MSQILQAAESGDRLETLKCLRDKLAATLDATESARDIPPLARRLAETLAEIATLEGEGGGSGSVLDEIVASRSK